MANILFVDDDFFTLETYARTFTLLGHRAIMAQTASEALGKAQEQPLDLIVLDMRLPDSDGFELLKTLKSNPKTEKIPAVMVSANPAAYAIQAHEAGAEHYLTKPIQTEKLLGIIEESTAKD